MVQLTEPNGFQIQYINYNSPLLHRNVENTTVIAADSFISLFIWRTLNITSVSDLMFHHDRQSIKFFYYSLTPSVMRDIITEQFRSMLPPTFLPERWTFQRIILAHGTECMLGSIFENYDILMDM